MRLTLCEVPTRETRPDHNTGNYESPTLFDKSVGSSPAYNARNTEDAGEGAYGSIRFIVLI